MDNIKSKEIVLFGWVLGCWVQPAWKTAAGRPMAAYIGIRKMVERSCTNEPTVSMWACGSGTTTKAPTVPHLPFSFLAFQGFVRAHQWVHYIRPDWFRPSHRRTPGSILNRPGRLTHISSKSAFKHHISYCLAVQYIADSRTTSPKLPLPVLYTNKTYYR
jgi:hypothetical protein